MGGIFCAMTNPEVDEITAVRLHLYTSQELVRDAPSTLRLHVCPTLPDLEREMELVENSEWGWSKCVGVSKVLYLWQGSRFALQYLEQEHTVTWHGFRVSIEFTLPVSRLASGGEGGGKGAADARVDTTAELNDAISIDVVEGEGRRGCNATVVAKRAGIPTTGYKLPFCTRLKETTRPKAPELALRERTAHHFAVTWQPPHPSRAGKSGGGPRPPEITHYAIELATAAPDGTYYPWDGLWIGAGHAAPDFAGKVAERMMKKDMSALAVKKLKKHKSERTSMDEAWTVYSYTLEVDPALSGKLRIRCWARGEQRPSPYSEELVLPRFKGKGTGGVEASERMIMVERRAYFSSLTQHVTDGSRPPHHRIGNAASSGKWGGDPMPPPPPQTAKEKAAGLLRAPVPYDVPRLPSDTPGLLEAGNVLAHLYRKLGVPGGGGGMFCGVRIDHVLHALVGTPTSDGKSAPRRTLATIRQPLIGFCEVVYADVLLPLVDTVVVLRDEWRYMDEKLGGIVAQIAAYRKQYWVCEPCLRPMICIISELGEMMRQCQEGQVLALHLRHQDYAKAVKRNLKEELATHICDLLWRISAELLQMQINIRKPFSPAELAAGARIANSAGRRFRHRKLKKMWRFALIKQQAKHGINSPAVLREATRSDGGVAGSAAAGKSAMAGSAVDGESAGSGPAGAQPSSSSPRALSRGRSAGGKSGRLSLQQQDAEARAAEERAAEEKAEADRAAEELAKMAEAAEKAEARVRAELQAEMEAKAAAEERRAYYEAQQAELEHRRREERQTRLLVNAARHMGRLQLAKGWATWASVAREGTHVHRMLLAVGSRLSRPKLASCYTHWRLDWHLKLLEEHRAEMAAAAKAAEARAAEERAAAAEAAAQKRQVLLRLHRMHKRDFPPPSPNAHHAAKMIAIMEARMGAPPAVKRRPSPRQSPRFGSRSASPRVRVAQPASPRLDAALCDETPPSLAVSIGPQELWKEYELHVQRTIADETALSAQDGVVFLTTTTPVKITEHRVKPWAAAPPTSRPNSARTATSPHRQQLTARPSSARPAHRTAPSLVARGDMLGSVLSGPAGPSSRSEAVRFAEDVMEKGHLLGL